VGRVSQQVLLLMPAEAKPIGPVAGLVEDVDEGGVVFVSGLATFTFAAGDEVGRRLAAVQLVATKIASQVEVAAAFGIDTATVWRWHKALGCAGVAGLIPGKTGPRGPNKLADAVVARIRELDAAKYSLARIGAEVGVDTATVRVALGRRRGSAGWEARKATAVADTDEDSQGVADRAEPAEPGEVDGGDVLPVLPAPVPRTGERAAARWGLLEEAPVVFTEGAHLPLAGLLLILPALAATGLLTVFESTYGRLRDGFYGLRVTV
jgi:transposase-like protein